VGVEEEVMLLQGSDLSPAGSSDQVLRRVPSDLLPSLAPETHASVLELKTRAHGTAAGAGSDLRALRRRLAGELRHQDLRGAVAGTHPFSAATTTRVSTAERYRLVAESMRSLAHREPTMALHVHVAVADPDAAVRVLGRVREAVPLALALSANSPFSHGSDSGFCSMRTLIFDGFPRTGPPRSYPSYADYVAGIDDLISLGALPDHTFLWRDVRLQPALGTVEVRVMDAQTRAEDIAPLAALVQSLACREVEGPPLEATSSPDVLEENRFLAARDGIAASFIDPHRRRRVGVPALVDEVIGDCLPYAVVLGCTRELEQLTSLAAVNGASRQRTWAAEKGMETVTSRLAACFDRDFLP
jgi:carboxylate-amine ligase